MIEKIIIGSAYGGAVALLGIIKDCRYEKFNPVKFIRSPLVATAWTFILAHHYPHLPVYLLGLTSISLERITVEVFKAIRSLEGKYKPGKFDYPMNEYAWYEMKTLGKSITAVYVFIILVNILLNKIMAVR